MKRTGATPCPGFAQKNARIVDQEFALLGRCLEAIKMAAVHNRPSLHFGQGTPRRTSASDKLKSQPASWWHRQHRKWAPFDVFHPGMRPGAWPWSIARIRMSGGFRGTGPNRSRISRSPRRARSLGAYSDPIPSCTGDRASQPQSGSPSQPDTSSKAYSRSACDSVGKAWIFGGADARKPPSNEGRKSTR